MTDAPPADEPLLVLSDGDLPEFEGRTPVGVNTNLQGGGQRITRPLHLDDKVVLVVEARVASVQHPMTKDGMKRTHVLKVEDLYELNQRKGQRLLSACKQAWRVSDDHRHGRTALEGLELDGGLELTTDGSGVVMTPGDLESDLGLDDASTDPVVVILVGGQRLMWPDEFPVGTPAPKAGDMVPAAGDGEADEAQVAELLDPVTGESLATWTDEDEHDRLLAEEQAAEAAEAREAAAEDVAVGRALTDGQLANRQPWDGYDAQPAKDVVSHLTTKVTDSDVARHVDIYEGAHKDRQGVLRAALARERYLTDREQRRAAGETVPADAAELGDLPPLPDEGGEG